jgi:hypothetical protein
VNPIPEKLKLRKPSTEELLAIANDPELLEKKKELDRAVRKLIEGSKRMSVELLLKPFDI